MPDNLETVSKKTKRGRPKAFGPELLSLARMVAPDARSERTLRNTAWAQLAVGLLVGQGGQPKTAEELGFDLSFIFDAHVYKKTILTELGMLFADQGDDAAMRAMKVVCENRMRARDAVAWIRRLRGEAKQPDAGSLMRRLVKTINDYLREHPEATWTDVQTSLGIVSAVVRESVGK